MFKKFEELTQRVIGNSIQKKNTILSNKKILSKSFTSSQETDIQRLQNCQINEYRKLCKLQKTIKIKIQSKKGIVTKQEYTRIVEQQNNDYAIQKIQSQRKFKFYPQLQSIPSVNEDSKEIQFQTADLKILQLSKLQTAQSLSKYPYFEQ